MPQVFEHELRHGEAQALVNSTKPYLLDELASAHVPYSGRARACLLITKSGIHSGHTTEYSPTGVETAEEQALQKVALEDGEFIGYVVAGRGVMKYKHVLPAPTSFDALKDRLGLPALCVALRPNSFDTFKQIEPESLNHAYAHRQKPLDLTYGNVENCPFPSTQTIDQICATRPDYANYWDIVEYAEINDGWDATFLDKLRRLGFNFGINFYLFGTAAAQGGPSCALPYDPRHEYNDLDIIAITNTYSPEEVELMVARVAFSTYPDYSLRRDGLYTLAPKQVWAVPADNILRGADLVAAHRKIDLYIGEDLAKTVTRPEGLERNFYAQLS